MQVAAALIGLVAVATVLGLLWRASQGRVQVARGNVRGIELGHHATLLQLSSEVCAPCRATARVLKTITTDGIRHVEVDVADRPDLASQFNVLQTPTTLILDAAGAVRARIGGAVRRDVVEAELLKVLAA
ncbi:MAG TPA: thioredoxin family protein [Pseudolysinimonas sp.]|jgi:thioredoxin-like negative regulator of GroEL